MDFENEEPDKVAFVISVYDEFKDEVFSTDYKKVNYSTKEKLKKYLKRMFDSNFKKYKGITERKFNELM
jgi:hypothetical protein